MINTSKPGLTEREKNILAILNCIILSGDTSAQDIAQNSGLSFATISRVTNMLIEKKIIFSSGKEITELGRHPNIISFNAKYGYIVHFDMLFDAVRGAIAGLDGKTINEISVPLMPYSSEIQLMGCLSQTFDELLKKSGIAWEKVMAAGVSVPGIVDRALGKIRCVPNIFPDIHVDLASMVREVLNTPVIINNDANLAAMGEWRTCYPHIKNMVYISISEAYGIGGGVILNGELFDGINGSAGEMGEMCFSPNNLMSGSVFKMGCLERYTGLKAVFAQIREMLKDGRCNILSSLLGDGEELSVQLIETAAEKGDLDVIDLYDNVLRIWSMMIINICAVIAPQIIILGGVYGSKYQLTLNKIKHYVSKGLYFNPDIKMSKLSGNKALRLGGLHAAKTVAIDTVLAKQALL